jgi:hypothetical protein
VAIQARTRIYGVDAAFTFFPAQGSLLKLIMKIDPLPGRPPDAMKPDIQCVRTQWIRGFIAFQLARRIRTVMRIVPV